MEFEIIRHLISEQFEVEEAEIKPDTLHREDLYADEYDFIELFMAIEEEFELEFNEDVDVTKFRTVNDVADYVKELL